MDTESASADLSNVDGWDALATGSDDEDNDDDYDPSLPAEYDSDEMSDTSDYEPIDEHEDTQLPPIQLHNTRLIRERLGNQPKLPRVLRILQYMESQDMNLPIFLDALSWGDQECISNSKVQYERTGLMVSEELPRILDRWYQVPLASSARSHYVRPKGARKALEEFAVRSVEEIIDRELEVTAHLFQSPSDGLSEKELTAFSFPAVISRIQAPSAAPNLWRIIRGATQRKRHRPRKHYKTRKNYDHTSLMIINQLQFSRSNHSSAWSKALTVFLKLKGLSAKALDLLHTFSVTQSHGWSVKAYARMSANAMAKVKELVKQVPYLLAYDNVNFPFQVYSQRIDNKNHFDSGTAGSIFVKPFLPPAPPLSSHSLREHRQTTPITPISLVEIVQLDKLAGPRIHAQAVHRVLQYLIQSPAFAFNSYTDRNHPAFHPPPPVKELPFGREYVTKEYVLGTVHLDEASYEGTDQIIDEWLRQLGLGSQDEHMRIGRDRLFVWLGDQLTVERLRGLAHYRAEDLNSFDRLDWMVTHFGWFHLVMAFANSLHKQYFGSTTGRGLRQAFSLLNRKGLQSVQIKGTFYHHLHEGIEHVAEAHFRACWCLVGGVATLEDLRRYSPTDLKAFAEEIVRSYASSDILEDQDMLQADERDEMLYQAVMWNRDVLKYLELVDAIKTGDVGRMEDLLPHLLFRFAGGGNSKYAIEVLELLQSLHREWPDDVKDFIQTNCWLVNMKGGRNNFLPIDLAMEHTIKDVKVTTRPKGPYTSWPLLKQRGPAIPTLRALDAHMNHEFPIIFRGTRHTSPAKEKDIGRLQENYEASRVHIFQKGREVGKSDNTADIITTGFLSLDSTMRSWWERRVIYERGKEEQWEPRVSQDTEADAMSL